MAVTFPSQQNKQRNCELDIWKIDAYVCVCCYVQKVDVGYQF